MVSPDFAFLKCALLDYIMRYSARLRKSHFPGTMLSFEYVRCDKTGDAAGKGKTGDATGKTGDTASSGNKTGDTASSGKGKEGGTDNKGKGKGAYDGFFSFLLSALGFVLWRVADLAWRFTPSRIVTSLPRLFARLPGPSA